VGADALVFRVLINGGKPITSQPPDMREERRRCGKKQILVARKVTGKSGIF